MADDCSYYCYKNNRKSTKQRIQKSDKIQLVCFDMDGVLVDTISSWKTIHDYFGTSNEQSVDDYLKGKIDDLEFIKRDISLWMNQDHPPTLKEIKTILYATPLMQGIHECITFLQQHHVKTAIVSAGLDVLAQRVAEECEIDYVFANGLKEDENGQLTGEGILQVQLMYKDKTVRHLIADLGIPATYCASIGNSCFDVPMFESSGLGIAFNAEDDCVKQSADIIVKGKDLRDLIPVLKPFV